MLLAALLLAPLAQATFLRCTIAEALNPVLQNGWFTSYSVSLTTVGACDAFCAADSKKPPFAYFDSSSFVCVCATAGPERTAGQVYYPASDASGTCASITISAITTRYGAATCLARYTTGAAVDLSASATDPAGCMYACLATAPGYTQTVYAPGVCLCARDVDPVPDDTCGAGALLLPRLSDVQPSLGLQYRRRARGQANAHCPGALEACVVPGTSGYECLDTQAELEACGGCLYGSLGNGTATGVDCSALRGPDRSVTCVRGRCVASGCVRGYVLRDGVCV